MSSDAVLGDAVRPVAARRVVTSRPLLVGATCQMPATAPVFCAVDHGLAAAGGDLAGIGCDGDRRQNSSLETIEPCAATHRRDGELVAAHVSVDRNRQAFCASLPGGSRT